MSFDCSNLKAGDRVWMGSWTSRKPTSIKTVSKVTPTQVVLDWNGNGSYMRRYHKGNGIAIQGGMVPEHIHSIASPESCAEWDAKQETERQERLRKENEAAAIETKCEELARCFPAESVSVSTESWGDAEQRNGKWRVELHGLTEKQVRELAEFWRQE